MGLFSSRKSDENVATTVISHVTTTSPTPTPDKSSVVSAFRSRFSTKKGKERDVDYLPYSGSPTSLSNATNKLKATSRHISSPQTPPSLSNGIGASPRASVSTRSILQRTYPNERPLPATPTKPSKLGLSGALTPSGSKRSTPSASGSRQRPSTPSRVGDDPQPVSLSATPPRKAADSVTTNLAQRLNELAVANSEGLLNDDEYRLLRQSLFDRFANSSVVPQESPMVPATRTRPSKGDLNDRPKSNFQVELPRPSSIRSPRNSMSIGDGVADLLKRATRRQSSVPAKESDASSVWSGKSGSSNLFRWRSVSKKSSSSSIGTTISRGQNDATITPSSNRAGASDTGHSEHGHRTRSIGGSIRRHKQAPPSSFPTRVIGQNSSTIRDLFDEDKLQTSQDIQREIKAVEAEQRRLMDAFNGLELTTLSKVRRHARPSPRSVDEMGSWTAHSESPSQRRLHPSDGDAHSVRSNTSGNAPSVGARSAYSSRSRTVVGKSPLSLKPGSVLPSPTSLHRSNSSSSFDRSFGIPPVPSFPALSAHGRLRAGNNASQVSLARSTTNTIPMDVVHEDEERAEKGSAILPEEGLEDDMDDIRRRREEVALRYEARLDYLRAKLKGAQLHEKLLKK